jgi:hypothetical protein
VAVDDDACPWTLRSPKGLLRLEKELDDKGYTTKGERASFLQQLGIHEVRHLPPHTYRPHQVLIRCSSGTTPSVRITCSSRDQASTLVCYMQEAPVQKDMDGRVGRLNQPTGGRHKQERVTGGFTHAVCGLPYVLACICFLDPNDIMHGEADQHPNNSPKPYTLALSLTLTLTP